MRPFLHASLVNGRFGDPALYVEMLFEKRALLIDLGDITFLPPRKIHRIEHVFVSHAHIDHFVGFDVLLRVLVGREKTVHLFGPSGFIERVAHKLHGYEWNLADLFQYDLGFAVTEIGDTGIVRAACFRLKKTRSPRSCSGRGVCLNTSFIASRHFWFPRLCLSTVLPASHSRCRKRYM
jgi:ribonuclease Z